MRFKILSPSREPVSAKDDIGEALFYLRQDDWNDYGFRTLYHLSVASSISTDGTIQTIGSVRIGKRGQTEGERLLTQDFELLSDGFFSLGQSIDFYSRIAKLPKKIQDILLNGLRDVVIFPKYLKGIANEPVFKISLLRNLSLSDDLFMIAPQIMSGDFSSFFDNSVTFKFKTPEMEQFVEFDFREHETVGFDFFRTLPNRIAVLIGRNGSGKSTLLYRLSRIGFASANDRNSNVLQNLGRIEPIGVGFVKIISISYSAFDSFQVPGITRIEKQRIADEIESGDGRYLFIGIRDVAKEIDGFLKTIEWDHTDIPEDFLKEERHTRTLLKSPERLASEFIKAVRLAQGVSFHMSTLGRAFRILSAETSLGYLKDIDFSLKDDKELSSFFLQLSTGHKFVLHSITCLAGYIRPRTLVLFDEPEMHLHPPLVAVLMEASTFILELGRSFMIVTTHSPVLLQETLKSHVFVVNKIGDFIKVTKPDIQTFGESIGLLTNHVFNLSTDITTFHNKLDDIIQELNLSQSEDILIGKITKLFQGQISIQAHAYLLSRIRELKK